MLCAHLSLSQCPCLPEGWGAVLRCGGLSSLVSHRLLAAPSWLLSNVPAGTGNSAGMWCFPQPCAVDWEAAAESKELPQFCVFILDGFSLNIWVNWVLAMLFLQPWCGEPASTWSAHLEANSTGQSPGGGSGS